MEYSGIDNHRIISIQKVYSVHYFEYANDFCFEGESHDFWEFICVDKGEVNIIAGNEELTLRTNDLFFHEPNEFHSVKTNGKSAPNLVVISFSCHDEVMHFFKHKKVQIDQKERDLLGKIISEARNSFNCRLDDPYLKTIPLKDMEDIGSIQLIFLYIGEFIIHLLRRYQVLEVLPNKNSTNIKSTKQSMDTHLFHRVVNYLQDHLYSQVSVDELCQIHSLSRSRLQKIFKERCNLGIIEYYSYLKIEEAKELIRTQNMNFTEIAELLGYSSIRYFSR